MTKTTDKLTQLSTKVPTSALEQFKAESKKFKSQGDFFVHLMQIFKNPAKVSGTDSKAMQALTEELSIERENVNAFREELSRNNILLTTANEEIERLKNIAPVEKEVIKEVPVELSENQILLTFESDRHKEIPSLFLPIVTQFGSPEDACLALLENFRNPKVVEKEVIKEVPVQLGENQVIFTFLPEVQKNARKVRPFMLHDRVLTSTTPDKQIDEFLNHAAKYFMRHKYDHVTNPL